ncbi:hypothetical protein [uncultured Nocardioides sp.]|uniref:hypothetical protein n=1 Tax=uncultured Nocardioides sp. TaxID=198441 RepID=UPI002601E4D4|nr:hypothetical protein [uncultured Nocardioides sp.]
MRIMMLAAALMLSGCAGSPGSGPSSQVEAHFGTYEATGEGGDAAELSGKLVVRGGCFLVDTDTMTYLPLFPTDHVTAPDKETLVYDDQTFRVGETISLGGSATPQDSAVLESAIVPECNGVSSDFWTVAQNS